MAVHGWGTEAGLKRAVLTTVFLIVLLLLLALLFFFPVSVSQQSEAPTSVAPLIRVQSSLVLVDVITRRETARAPLCGFGVRIVWLLNETSTMLFCAGPEQDRQRDDGDDFEAG